MPSLTINELPLHSPWPARLLGSTEVAPRENPSQVVTREYEDEKWAPPLARVRSRNSQVTLEAVSRWFLGEKPVPFQCVDDSDENRLNLGAAAPNGDMAAWPATIAARRAAPTFSWVVRRGGGMETPMNHSDQDAHQSAVGSVCSGLDATTLGNR